jgi:hypothetical protein
MYPVLRIVWLWGPRSKASLQSIRRNIHFKPQRECPAEFSSVLIFLTDNFIGDDVVTNVSTGSTDLDGIAATGLEIDSEAAPPRERFVSRIRDKQNPVRRVATRDRSGVQLGFQRI